MSDQDESFTGDVYVVIDAVDDMDKLGEFDTLAEARKFQRNSKVKCEVWAETFVDGKFITTHLVTKDFT